MHEQTYHFGPLGLQVHTHDAEQQQHLARCWKRLFRITPITAQPSTAAHISIRLGATPRVSDDLPAEMDSQCSHFGNIRVQQTATAFHFGCGQTAITIVHGQRQATGYLAPDFGAYALVEQRDFWQRVFFLLVRQANCYIIHANALYPPAGGANAGILLIGDCGSGKTTLTMSLISAGWRYVSDDSVLLQPLDDGTVMAYAVRRGFACTAQAAAHWPWLAPLLAAGAPLNRQKTLIDLDTLYPKRFTAKSRPQQLFFPRITGAPQSTIEPLTKVQSFTTLLGQPRSGILVGPAGTAGLLTLYKMLVNQTSGYQLALGWDVLQQPAQVNNLLTQAVEQG